MSESVREELVAAREAIRRALGGAKRAADEQGVRAREAEFGPHGRAAEVRAETERHDRWEEVVSRLDGLITELDDLEREVEDLGDPLFPEEE
ncbi:MAG: hypothetical protein AB7N76_34020 [Planctomycetota bacterium]